MDAVFSTIYNPHMAVKVGISLAARHPDFRMLMAGSDHGQMEEIKTLIRQNGLEDKIQLPGYIGHTQNSIMPARTIFLSTPTILIMHR